MTAYRQQKKIFLSFLEVDMFRYVYRRGIYRVMCEWAIKIARQVVFPQYAYMVGDNEFIHIVFFLAVLRYVSFNRLGMR
jgi:hypothetical protein